jgi:hypothetical protein
VVTLKNEANILLVNFRAGLFVEAMDGKLQKIIFAGPGRIVHAEQVKECRLPRPGRTHNGDEFALFDIEIDAAKNISLGGTVFEKLFDVP